MKLNGYLAKSTIVAALGGLLFGFDTAVISGTTSALTQTYQLSPFLLGVTVFSALFGTVLGAMLAGFPGERFGRRDSLRVMAVLYLISGLGCAFAWNWHALVCFALSGDSASADPRFLGPCTLRRSHPRSCAAGWLECFNSMSFSASCLPTSRIMSSGCNTSERLNGGGNSGSLRLPAALFFVMLFTIPRSPRWLVKKGRVDEARTVLRMTGDEDYEHDLQEIVASIGEEQSRAAEKLFTRKYAFPDLPRGQHRNIQPALRHQRDSLLFE